jgi:hypothetical protein
LNRLGSKIWSRYGTQEKLQQAEVAHLKHGRTQNSCFVICLRLLLVRHQSQQKSRYLLDGAQSQGRDWPISSCGRSIRRVAAHTNDIARQLRWVGAHFSRSWPSWPSSWRLRWHSPTRLQTWTADVGLRPQTWPARIAALVWPLYPLNLWPLESASISGISGPRRFPAIRYFRVILLRHSWSCKFGTGASLAKFGGASGHPKFRYVSNTGG